MFGQDIYSGWGGGGITDLIIQSPAIVPEGTQLIYEINVGGKWYPITEAREELYKRGYRLPYSLYSQYVAKRNKQLEAVSSSPPLLL